MFMCTRLGRQRRRRILRLITGILSNTPPWAFALLVYFVYQGLRSLKTRTVTVWRALIVPALFIVMGLSRITFGHETGSTRYVSWLAGAALFAPLALLTGPRLLAVDRNKGWVTRPGSPVSLIRNVAVFVLQYSVGIAEALKLERHAAIAVIGHVVSGAEAGYFAGWAVVFLNRYRNAEKSGISP